MTDAEIIEQQCEIIKVQAESIKELSAELSQFRAIEEEEKNELQAVW